MGTFGPARAVYTSLYLLSAPIAFGPFSKCLCFKKMTPFGNEKNSVFSKFFGPIAPARPEKIPESGPHHMSSVLGPLNEGPGPSSCRTVGGCFIK